MCVENMEMEELYKISIILKELREKNGYTQKFIADKLGIKYQSYQSYERGLTVPTLIHFIEIADLYDVSLEYLIGRQNI